MADYFKQSRTDIVIKILGREFFLSRAREPITHIGSEFISDIGGNGMDKHC